MKINRLLAILVLASSCLVPTASSAQASAPDQAPKSLVGSWLVTVDGDVATRTLIVTEEAPTNEGALLAAKYGMTNQGQGPIDAKMLRVRDQRQLVLVTQASTRIVATERPDGTFQGTFTLKSGGVKEVTIARFSEALAQQQAAQAANCSPTAFPKPIDQLDSVAHPLGIGGCATTRTALWTAAGGAIVEIRQPQGSCSFDKLDLVVNGKRYTSAAVDDAFYRDKTWTGSSWYPVNRWRSASGRVFFCVNRQFGASDVQGILERGCAGSDCLDEPSAKAAAK